MIAKTKATLDVSLFVNELQEALERNLLSAKCTREGRGLGLSLPSK